MSAHTERTFFQRQTIIITTKKQHPKILEKNNTTDFLLNDLDVKNLYLKKNELINLQLAS